jgi:hypothetical protein
MDAHSVIKPIFLSASEPDPSRSEEYWQSRKLLNVREAVRAFCAYVLPRYPVVFGGHPAITPLVRQVADRLGHQAEASLGANSPETRRPKILLFQSRFFVEGSDTDEMIFTDPHKTDGTRAEPDDGWRNASLLRMRYEMLARPNTGPVHRIFEHLKGDLGVKRERTLHTDEFAAAVFIGGMEGVQREFKIFRAFHPNTPAYPIVTTGSACVGLFEEVRNNLDEKVAAALRREQAYSLLMQQIVPASPAAVAPSVAVRWRARTDPAAYSPETHIDPPELDRPRRRPGALTPSTP